MVRVAVYGRITMFPFYLILHVLRLVDTQYACYSNSVPNDHANRLDKTMVEPSRLP